MSILNATNFNANNTNSCIKPDHIGLSGCSCSTKQSNPVGDIATEALASSSHSSTVSTSLSTRLIEPSKNSTHFLPIKSDRETHTELIKKIEKENPKHKILVNGLKKYPQFMLRQIITLNDATLTNTLLMLSNKDFLRKANYYIFAFNQLEKEYGPLLTSVLDTHFLSQNVSSNIEGNDMANFIKCLQKFCLIDNIINKHNKPISNDRQALEQFQETGYFTDHHESLDVVKFNKLVIQYKNASSDRYTVALLNYIAQEPIPPSSKKTEEGKTFARIFGTCYKLKSELTSVAEKLQSVNPIFTDEEKNLLVGLRKSLINYKPDTIKSYPLTPDQKIILEKRDNIEAIADIIIKDTVEDIVRRKPLSYSNKYCSTMETMKSATQFKTTEGNTMALEEQFELDYPRMGGEINIQDTSFRFISSNTIKLKELPEDAREEERAIVQKEYDAAIVQLKKDNFIPVLEKLSELTNRDDKLSLLLQKMSSQAAQITPWEYLSLNSHFPSLLLPDPGDAAVTHVQTVPTITKKPGTEALTVQLQSRYKLRLVTDNSNPFTTIEMTYHYEVVAKGDQTTVSDVTVDEVKKILDAQPSTHSESGEYKTPYIDPSPRKNVIPSISSNLEGILHNPYNDLD